MAIVFPGVEYRQISLHISNNLGGDNHSAIDQDDLGAGFVGNHVEIGDHLIGGDEKASTFGITTDDSDDRALNLLSCTHIAKELVKGAVMGANVIRHDVDG